MDTNQNDPKSVGPAKDGLVVGTEPSKTPTEPEDKQPKPLDVLPNTQPSRTAANSSRRLMILAGLFIVAVICLSLFMILRSSS